MKFAKMHGLGNNYIFVEDIIPEDKLSSFARKVSNVNTGIGSDGLILIGSSQCADFSMRIFNSDGSEGMNCGNGIRCVAKYVFETNLTQNRHFFVETKSGIVEVWLDIDLECKVREVTVDMGKPRLSKAEIPMIGDPNSNTILKEIDFNPYKFLCTIVSVGNPHTIITVEDISHIDVLELGPLVENSVLFPERTNVEWMKIISSSEIQLLVWERGSGITQACGTGACAAVAAGILQKQLNKNEWITVGLLGGKLKIKWNDKNHILMKGPAEWVARGEIYL